MGIDKKYESALEGSDGWIQWAGGECPVDSDAIVEVKYRWHNQHQYNNDRAGDFYWAHTGSNADIISYRLQNPGIDSRANDDRLEQDLNECIGQVVAAEWDGEGLPPVGAKVEFFINPKVEYRNDWIPDAGTEMEVVAHKTTTDGNDVAVCYWDEGGAVRSCCFVPESLKPLRTEAEKARDAAIVELSSVIDYRNGCSSKPLAGWLYDAIAEGKIPGVKLEEK